MKKLSIAFLVGVALASIIATFYFQSAQNQAAPTQLAGNRNTDTELSNGGCQYDTQCKEDRVCDRGQCVNPSKKGNSAKNNPPEKHQTQSMEPDNTSLGQAPIEVNWGQLEKDFLVENYSLGRSELKSKANKTIYQTVTGVTFDLNRTYALG